MISLGSKNGLRFRIEWRRIPDDPKVGIPQDGSVLGFVATPTARTITAETATEGTITASLGPHLIWGVTNKDQTIAGFRWTLVEVVEHLADTWPALMWEEEPPLDLDLERLSTLRYAAQQRWQAMPSERVSLEEEAVWLFEENHDLAKGFQGAWPPPLWLLREGAQMRVCGKHHELRIPLSEVRDALTDLGECIALRLGQANDERSKHAVRRWKNREAIDVRRFVSVASGLSRSQLDDLSLGDDKNVRQFFEIPLDGFEVTEVLAAARMLGSVLSTSAVKCVLQTVRRMDLGSCPLVDELAQRALKAQVRGRPYDEGYAAAAWLRDELGIQDERVDPEQCLVDWGIAVEEISFQENVQLDAVAVWGPRHGPCVLVNPKGDFARMPNGRRTTFAHEICHLLLDRTKALPLVDVLGGRAPARVEARARAFAVEFLLPRRVAAERLKGGGSVEGVVTQLAKEYGVSNEVVAWQLRNSDAGLTQDDTAYLRGLVRDQRKF